jgi:hypothetical protein
MPNMKRSLPEETSVPTVPSNRPSKATPMPRNREPRTMAMPIASTSTNKAANSGGPNSSRR